MSLVLPPEVRALDPLWATCGMQWDGVYDPPYALHGAQQAAAPSPMDPWSNLPTSTPAAPCIVPSAPTPTPTGESAPGNPGGSNEPASPADPNGSASSSDSPDPDSPGSARNSMGPSNPASVNAGGIVSSILGSASPPTAQPAPRESPSNPDGSIMLGGLSQSADPSSTWTEGPYALKPAPQAATNVPSFGNGDAPSGGYNGEPIGAGGSESGTEPSAGAGSGAGGMGGSASGSGYAAQSMVGPDVGKAPGSGGDVSPGAPTGSVSGNGGAGGGRAEGGTGSGSGGGSSPPGDGGSPPDPDANPIGGDPSSDQQPNPDGSPGSFPAAPPNGQNPEPTTSAAIITIGSETHTVASGGALILSSATLVPGGPAATVAGQIVSVASDGVAVGSSTASYLQPLAGASQAQPTAVVTIGSQAHTIAAGGSLDLGSATLVEGGSIATVSGQIVSVAPQGVIVGSKTVAYSASPMASADSESSSSGAVFTFGTQTYTAPAGTGGSLVMGSTTLSPGGALTFSGTVISMGTSGIVVGSSTLPYVVLPSNGPTPTPEPVITVGGNPYTALNGGSFIISGQTLTPGGTITVGGSTIGLSPSGQPAIANVNGASQTLSSAFVENQPLSSGALLTIGSQIITASDPAGKSGEAIIGSQTLTAGGSAATIAGQVISLGQNGLVVGGTQTVPFSPLASGETSVTAGSQAVFSIGPQALTALDPAGSSGIVVIGSQTLTLGGADATILGQEVSLGTAGLVLGGSSTVTFSTVLSVPTAAAASVTFTGADGAIETAFSLSGGGGVAVIDGTTLSVGGSGVSIDGQFVSEATGGLAVGSSTIAFSTSDASSESTAPTGTAGSGSNSGSGFESPGIAGLSDARKSISTSYLAAWLSVVSTFVMTLIA
ncbi:MAG: hypothetical protein M1822_002815 [Bathelium mastoideum]|nr:MAG: hypothetical protein M1822_002815 [Bathelium mastoideum]